MHTAKINVNSYFLLLVVFLQSQLSCVVPYAHCVCILNVGIKIVKLNLLLIIYTFFPFTNSILAFKSDIYKHPPLEEDIAIIGLINI